MKQKSFYTAILLIFISWAGNYLYFQSKQLDEPIFLKHYYEAVISENDLDNNQLTFYYLVNKNDQSNVHYVKVNRKEYYPIPEMGMWEENTPTYIEEFQHHYLKSVTINFSKDMIPIKNNQASWSFKNMEVGFDNNPPTKVNIGHIIFTPVSNEKPVLETVMSSGSSDHRHEQGLVANKSLSIEKITVPFPQLEDDVELKIKSYNSGLMENSSTNLKDNRVHETLEDTEGFPINSEQFPIHLKKGDQLTLKSFIQPKEKYYLQFSFHIQGRTKSGKSYSTKVGIIDRPYLTQKDIDKIIASYGGEKR